MRLINCSTRQLEEFFSDDIPQYAILSHTWGDGEVLFADLPLDQSTKTSAGYQKIESMCTQAIRDGLNYAWIDTCCIDKSSSSELSEAINSMFAWYKSSACCYAYLPDVLGGSMDEQFFKSRWFTRGWTLQELLAPRDVIFYDKEWKKIGRRTENAESISRATGIDAEALTQSSFPEKDRSSNIEVADVDFSSFCIAKRMSWASHRETTRPEDIAYCLLGIFDVYMPLMYGEGDRAFLRLQEEIMRRNDDDSILAWGLGLQIDHFQGLVSDRVKTSMTQSLGGSDLLARSPKDFISCANLQYTSGPISQFTLTNVGLQIKLPLIPASQQDDSLVSEWCHEWIGLLSCSSSTSSEFLGIPLILTSNEDDSRVQEMTRIQIDLKETSVATIIVGPRAAVKSVPCTIIVPRHGDNTRMRGYFRGHQQIIINESKGPQEGGYQTRNWDRSNITGRDGEVMRAESTWNPETLVLALENHQHFRSLIQVCFERMKDKEILRFSVFMHTASGRVSVREGDTFSKEDKRSLYELLAFDGVQDDSDETTVQASERDMFRVNASTRKANVYDHRIFEISVQAEKVEFMIVD